MSNYIVLNNQSDEETLVSKINQCSFIGEYLSKEELDFIVDCIEEDKSDFIVFETGFLINSIKTRAGKVVCWGRLDGVKQIDEVADSGMFFRKETRLVEREGDDPQYDKLLKSLVGRGGEDVESAIWTQHIDLTAKYIPEMELAGEYIRSLIESGVTDEKDYTVAIKESEDQYEVTTIAIAYHKSGNIARSTDSITLSKAEFEKLIEVINS